MEKKFNFANYGLKNYCREPISMRIRNRWEFMAILSGDAFPTFKTEHHEKILPEPSLFAFRPDSVHGWSNLKDAPVKRVVINTEIAPPEPLRELLQGMPFMQRPLTNTERVWEIGKAMRHNVLVPDACSPLRNKIFIAELSVLMLEHYLAEHELQAGTKARRIAASALQWYYDHLEERPGVTDVAAAVGVSESQLRRLFREALGDSPYKALLRIKISRVKEMLSNTTLSGSEIAFATGFSSVIVFTQTFKREVGHSPMVYRSLASFEE